MPVVPAACTVSYTVVRGEFPQRIAHVFSLSSLFFSNLSLATRTMQSLTSMAQCHLQPMYLLITNVTAVVIIFETIAPFLITLLIAERASE